MESDIIRGDIAVMRQMEMGDFVAIKSVGAYDASMAFPFGAGWCCGSQR
jgi:diaminopimelate decarboxylase